MGLVFEKHQPFFFHRAFPVVHFHRHHHRAGIDLVRFLQILKLPFLFQLAHCHQRQIHQAHELVFPSGEDLLSGIQVALISGFQGCLVIALLKGDIFQFCGKCGMAAMIRPVGIQHPDLRHGRIPVLLLFKIILNMKKVLEGHGKGKAPIQFL